MPKLQFINNIDELPTSWNWKEVKNCTVAHSGREIQIIKQVKFLSDFEYHGRRFAAVLLLILSLGLAYLTKPVKQLLKKHYKVRSFAIELNTASKAALLNRNSKKAAEPNIQAGFSNGGNTCFLATTLQIIKALKVIRHLPQHFQLEQKKGESDADFLSRCQLRAYVLKLLHLSTNGIAVTSEQMHKLHKLMDCCYPHMFPVGEGADPMLTITENDPLGDH